MSALLRAYVHGLQIDAQSGKGGVVHLVVRADEKHQGLIGRLRQHLANALFRAGDLCYPSHDQNACRVVELVVGDAAGDDARTKGAGPNVREVWPVHLSDGQACYHPLVAYEGVKRHQNGRPASDKFVRLSREHCADDSHVFSAVKLVDSFATKVSFWPE